MAAQRVIINSDLNVNPEECIVPLASSTTTAGTLKLRGQPEGAQPIRITLNDCLVCTGCVTSAEEVFLRELNTDALERAIREAPGRPLTFSFSLASSLSMANVLLQSYDLEALASILSMGLSRKIAALVGVAPTIQILFEVQSQALSAAMQVQQLMKHLEGVPPSGPQTPTPTIVTDCPAVRMFISKRNSTLAPLILPVASQMEVSGVNHEGLFVSIQPCQDRKLEQFRGASIDICLTTQELLVFLGEYLDLNDRLASSSDSGLYRYPFAPLLAAYLHQKGVLCCSFEALFSSTNPGQLAWTKRGNGLDSFTLPLHPTGFYDTIMVYRCHGYHNLQNVVRRLSSMCTEPRTLYVFEMHACPHGCFGGACIAGDDQHPLASVASGCSAEADLHDSGLVRALFDDPSILATIENIPLLESVIRTDQEYLSPEEIAVRKGGVRLQDLGW
ncbi:Nar1 [Giardia muris]|uniref:Nar1 n=1 Tax=Giardia muris TaxID=5742 RepID=A0A4Z1SND6_GIAMU|nr:Nar1 [Giardia muris]|eukprot:TNJ27130.1 Nar1 [Giardia muris]